MKQISHMICKIDLKAIMMRCKVIYAIKRQEGSYPGWSLFYEIQYYTRERTSCMKCMCMFKAYNVSRFNLYNNKLASIANIFYLFNLIYFPKSISKT